MWFARASYGDMFCITKARYSLCNDVRFAVGDLEIITHYVWFCAETCVISQIEKKYFWLLLLPSLKLCLRWDGHTQYSVYKLDFNTSSRTNNTRELNHIYTFPLYLINWKKTRKRKSRVFFCKWLTWLVLRNKSWTLRHCVRKINTSIMICANIIM